jgi:hypothetical protein
MGIEYSAALIVGLHRDQIDAEDQVEQLDQAAPYYDGSDEAIVGVIVERTGDYQAKEITLDQANVDAAMAKFRELTGQDGKLYLTPRGY